MNFGISCIYMKLQNHSRVEFERAISEVAYTGHGMADSVSVTGV